MAVRGKGGLFRSSWSSPASPIVAGWAVGVSMRDVPCNVAVGQTVPIVPGMNTDGDG